jgi:hypothetical protein
MCASSAVCAHFLPATTQPQVMSTLPALENAFLRYTNLRGRLNCSVLAASRNLQRLSFSGNTDLVGELPGCLFEVRLSGWAVASGCGVIHRSATFAQAGHCEQSDSHVLTVALHSGWLRSHAHRSAHCVKTASTGTFMMCCSNQCADVLTRLPDRGVPCLPACSPRPCRSCTCPRPASLAACPTQ